MNDIDFDELEKIDQQETKVNSSRKFKIFGMTLPLSYVLLSAIVVGAVAIWILTQTTTIYIEPLETPTISEDIVITAEIGSVTPKEITIYNPNEIPMLSSSKWTVFVNGINIGEGYTVSQLQEFVLAKSISVSPTDNYGCSIEGVCADLVIPPNGQATFTILFHVPQTYEYDGDTVYITSSDVIQVKYEPTETQWTGGEFDGDEVFNNPVCDSYSWCNW